MDRVNRVKICFDEGRVMQIGTLHNGRPRVNSVYFVPADDYTYVYWMSEPGRRHSTDIDQDNRVAAAIAFKTDWPVIGIQFAGTGEVVKNDSELETIISKYNKKYHDAAKGLYERIAAGTNKHLIYRLSVNELELFDGELITGGGPVAVALS